MKTSPANLKGWQKGKPKSRNLGLNPIYELKNAYGKRLIVCFIEKGYVIKDMNPALAYDRRKSALMIYDKQYFQMDF